MTGNPLVSVVIATYNMAGTLAGSLDSVRVQSFDDWEIIVVDDGSTDSTLQLAGQFIRLEPRCRVLTQGHSGVAAARNTGIEAARGEWLLFLDGDDTIAPAHLEQLMGVAISRPHVGAVHSGWIRVRGGRDLFGEEFGPSAGDLFDILAVRPAFVLHSCLVRRSVVVEAGCFDTGLGRCAEDWDLWQRVSRAGTQFGNLRKATAIYQIHSDSKSSNVKGILESGLKTIRRGHEADPRVRRPHPKHATGRDRQSLFAAEVHFVCWCAASLLAHRNDAQWVLDALPSGRQMPPAADSIAATMFDGLVLKCGSNDEELLRSWVEIRSSAVSFLRTAEERLHSAGLARSVARALDERILRRANPANSLPIGSILALPVDVTKPLIDLRVPPDIDRILCSVSWGTQFIGTVALPVIAGEVSAAVVQDAIADAYCWQIIGAFLSETIYSGLQLQVSDGRASVHRNGVHLATWQPTTADARAEIHDRVGWTVFLQELWGRYDWDSSQFYGDVSVLPEVTERSSLPDIAKQSRRWLQHLTRTEAQHRTRCEIGETLPPDGTASGDLIEVTLGGALLGCMPIGSAVPRSADDWISAITRWAGLELCRVAVRELLIGWTGQSGCLRDRLIARDQAAPLAGIHDDVRDHRILIGRRSPTSTGLSSSRRAILPAETARPLLELAQWNGEASHVPMGGTANVHVIEYVPDLLAPQINLAHRSSPQCSVPQSGRTRFSRIDFEAFFARAEDPWGYTNDFERLKYEQTLALLDGMEIGRALELACAEGHFTKMLSPRVAELLATDISEIALQRAAKSCADCSNVSYQRLDLVEDPITGPFDLIVCSEVLYYLEDLAMLRAVAMKLAGALSDGGNLLMAHANLVVDEPDCPGRDWGHAFGAKTVEDTFRATEGLSLQKQILTPLYRIQLFQRGAPNATKEPLTQIAVMGNLPPKVSARVLWKGGTALNDGPSGATERLPILMYHRIAPLVAPHRNRYTVTPEAFNQQMRFLSESGAYTTRMEDWHNAMRDRQPLPGKAVLLTFDDGYDDFFEFAWPTLRRYKLSATVFVVAGRIGQTSDWTDERAALLNSRRIRELSANGIEIGSHTHTHRSLLTISSERIVQECAESRLALEKLLGQPIKTLAYPYGEVDEAAAHLAGACGYEFAFAVGHRLSTFTDRLLMLPRLEISGLDDFQDFSAKLAAGSV